MENKVNPTPTDIQNCFKRVEQDDIFAQLGASGTAAIVLIGWIFSVVFANLFVLGGIGISVPILTAAFFGFVIPYFAKKHSLSPMDLQAFPSKNRQDSPCAAFHSNQFL